MSEVEMKGEEAVGNFAITFNHSPNVWFFQYTKDGHFVWNPELITAFVNQVQEERIKQAFEEGHKIYESMQTNKIGDKNE